MTADLAGEFSRTLNISAPASLSVAGYWWLMVAHSFQFDILKLKKDSFSHNTGHQSDNSQIKPVLQTRLSTDNGFAGLSN